VASTLAFIFRIEAEMHQRVVPFARFHDDVAAAATVAAGRPAAGNKLLPAKGHASVAAIAGLNPDDCFINKHAVYIDCTGQGGDSPERRKGGPAVAAVPVIASMVMKSPRFLALWNQGT